MVAVDQAPVIIQLAFSRLGLRAEDLPETLDQRLTAERAAEQPANRTEQQFLHQQRTMGFRKKTAIEEHATGNFDAFFVVPSEQLLSNAVAVVVGEDVHGLFNLQMGKQCLLQIGLFQQAVGVIARFCRIAETEHVAGDHLITLGQWLPQVVPIPTGGGKTVNQQQRFTLPDCPVADRLATKDKSPAALAPDTQRNLGEWH